jgi:hypothetical protein
VVKTDKLDSKDDSSEPLSSAEKKMSCPKKDDKEGDTQRKEG